MSGTLDMAKARNLLNGFSKEAELLMSDPSRVEDLLRKAEQMLKEIPAVGAALSRLPLMISLIRAYIRREYDRVSARVIVTMLCAVIYLLKGKDLMPDRTSILGYADDIAVIAAALRIVEPELDAYSRWREERAGS